MPRFWQKTVQKESWRYFNILIDETVEFVSVAHHENTNVHSLITNLEYYIKKKVSALSVISLDCSRLGISSDTADLIGAS